MPRPPSDTALGGFPPVALFRMDAERLVRVIPGAVTFLIGRAGAATMVAMKRTAPAGSEQLISALLPAVLPRQVPAAASLPVLPAHRLPAAPEALPLLDVARLDRSGRLSARAALRRLGWRPGHRLDINIIDGALLVASAVGGAHAVGSRGDLALPAAARAMCSIAVTDAVIVAVYPAHGVAVIHPVATVSRLAHQVHMRMAAGNGG